MLQAAAIPAISDSHAFYVATLLQNLLFDPASLEGIDVLQPINILDQLTRSASPILAAHARTALANMCAHAAHSERVEAAFAQMRDARRAQVELRIRAVEALRDAEWVAALSIQAVSRRFLERRRLLNPWVGTPAQSSGIDGPLGEALARLLEAGTPARQMPAARAESGTLPAGTAPALPGLRQRLSEEGTGDEARAFSTDDSGADTRRATTTGRTGFMEAAFPPPLAASGSQTASAKPQSPQQVWDPTQPQLDDLRTRRASQAVQPAHEVVQQAMNHQLLLPTLLQGEQELLKSPASITATWGQQRPGRKLAVDARLQQLQAESTRQQLRYGSAPGSPARAALGATVDSPHGLLRQSMGGNNTRIARPSGNNGSLDLSFLPVTDVGTFLPSSPSMRRESADRISGSRPIPMPFGSSRASVASAGGPGGAAVWNG